MILSNDERYEDHVLGLSEEISKLAASYSSEIDGELVFPGFILDGVSTALAVSTCAFVNKLQGNEDDSVELDELDELIERSIEELKPKIEQVVKDFLAKEVGLTTSRQTP